MVGRIRAPDRDARTRCSRAPPPPTGALGRDTGYPVGHAPSRSGLVASSLLALLVLARLLPARAGAVVRSDRPLHRRRPRAGRLSGPRGARPEDATTSAAPETLDSGRNCSPANLGLARGAGHQRGSLRRRDVDVRGRAGRGPRGVHRAGPRPRTRSATSTTTSADAAGRTTITGQTSPTIAGRQGRRLDTKTGERIQTVVVWPSAEPDIVNVVITNDLPDARIQDAIDAFGGADVPVPARHGLVRVVGGRLCRP